MDAIRTADGRSIEYVELGDPRGRPVIHLHGTPATAGSAALFDEVALRAGVRLVAMSRPGYGATTTTEPGLLSVGHDVGELATALGIAELVVWGTSGGGPYALATAVALPTRVDRVLVAAGVGPVADVAPDTLEPEDLRSLDLLAAGDVDRAVALATAAARREFDDLRVLPEPEFAAAFAAMVPPGEQYLARRPADARMFFADVRRALGRLDGYVRDNLSWLGRWDFDPGSVAAPVVLAYGELDAMVPPVHGEWLHARLPASSLTVHAGAGHGDVTFGLAESLLSTLDTLPGREESPTGVRDGSFPPRRGDTA